LDNNELHDFFDILDLNNVDTHKYFTQHVPGPDVLISIIALATQFNRFSLESIIDRYSIKLSESDKYVMFQFAIIYHKVSYIEDFCKQGLDFNKNCHGAARVLNKLLTDPINHNMLLSSGFNNNNLHYLVYYYLIMIAIEKHNFGLAEAITIVKDFSLTKISNKCSEEFAAYFNSGNVAAIHYLVTHDVDVLSFQFRGSTGLELAKENNQDELVRYLLNLSDAVVHYYPSICFFGEKRRQHEKVDVIDASRRLLQ
jgi:hypothetical protein